MPPIRPLLVPAEADTRLSCAPFVRREMPQKIEMLFERRQGVPVVILTDELCNLIKRERVQQLFQCHNVLSLKSTAKKSIEITKLWQCVKSIIPDGMPSNGKGDILTK